MEALDLRLYAPRLSPASAFFAGAASGTVAALHIYIHIHIHVYIYIYTSTIPLCVCFVCVDLRLYAHRLSPVSAFFAGAASGTVAAFHIYIHIHIRVYIYNPSVCVCFVYVLTRGCMHTGYLLRRLSSLAPRAALWPPSIYIHIHIHIHIHVYIYHPSVCVCVVYVLT